MCCDWPWHAGDESGSRDFGLKPRSTQACIDSGTLEVANSLMDNLGLNGVVELVVPVGTCKSIASRVITSPKSAIANPQSTNCDDFGNQLKTEVKVRLGRSWLVCVRELNGVEIDKPFTITIPSAGTELIVKVKTNDTIATGKNTVKDDLCNFSRSISR